MDKYYSLPDLFLLDINIELSNCEAIIEYAFDNNGYICENYHHCDEDYLIISIDNETLSDLSPVVICSGHESCYDSTININYTIYDNKTAIIRCDGDKSCYLSHVHFYGPKFGNIYMTGMLTMFAYLFIHIILHP